MIFSGYTHIFTIRGGQLYFQETTLTAERILSGTRSQDEQNAQNEAVAFLRELLGRGEVTAKEVKSEAAGLGLTEQMLRTARARLGVEVYKRGNAFGTSQKWYWRIKETSSEEGV